MTPTETTTVDELRPVREALLAQAREDADRVIAAARAEAAAVLDAAHREADAIRGRARALGQADAEAVLAARRSRTRRAARATVLRAQRDVYDEVHRRVRAAVTAMRDDDAYPGLLARLAAQGRATLGADATVTESSTGGVVCESGGRRAVYTLEALADRALAAQQSGVAELWTA